MELPVDALVLMPGNIDVRTDTNEAGFGQRLVEPGPDDTTDYELLASRDGATTRRAARVTLLPPEILQFTMEQVAKLSAAP